MAVFNEKILKGLKVTTNEKLYHNCLKWALIKNGLGNQYSD
jgi:hypothetical protein